MAKYDGTYLCGHAGTVIITGPTKNRDWIKARRFSEYCPDCREEKRKKENDKKNKVSNERTNDMELPELSGSEKQVQWANTLRVNFIDVLQNEIDYVENHKITSWDEIQEILITLMQYAILNKTTAKYWINNRDWIADKSSSKTMIARLNEDYLSKKKSNEILMQEEARKNSIVSPIEKKYNGIVVIKGDDFKITLEYEKNERFIEIVKDLGYKWNDVWKRELTQCTGNFANRAAEIGNTLLVNGFSIQIYDDKIRENAVNGFFEPECKKWIKKMDDTNLIIHCPKRELNNIWMEAKKIDSTKVRTYSIVIPISQYKEIMDFAEIYSFRFVNDAMELLEKYKAEIESADTVIPKQPNKTIQDDKLRKILLTSSAILEDLADD